MSKEFTTRITNRYYRGKHHQPAKDETRKNQNSNKPSSGAPGRQQSEFSQNPNWTLTQLQLRPTDCYNYSVNSTCQKEIRIKEISTIADISSGRNKKKTKHPKNTVEKQIPLGKSRDFKEIFKMTYSYRNSTSVYRQKITGKTDDTPGKTERQYNCGTYHPK